MVLDRICTGVVGAIGLVLGHYDNVSVLQPFGLHQSRYLRFFLWML